MDETFKQFQANELAVKQKLADTDVNVRTKDDLMSLVASGVVGSVVAHDSESDGIKPRLQVRGVIVHGNHKCPRGFVAAYDKNDKLIGLYQL